jgi:hypothetical protein
VERILTVEQIDFGDSASSAVVSDAHRYVLPVPVLAGGGEPLVRPDGAPLIDREGRAIVGRGIVLFDHDDNAWEVAPGDGSAVILFGPVTEAAADAFSRRIGELASDPRDLTLSDLKALIAFACGELAIRASYTTSWRYVDATMVPEAGVSAGGHGLYRRRADQVCRAVYVPGAGAFRGPAASPQLFADGAVIIQHADSVRLAQPASFEAFYRFLDGRPARVSELASQSP